MWDLFTETTRKTIFYAQEEAQRFGSRFVSTEPLLLGVIREADFVAAKVLEQMKIDEKKVRKVIERQVPRNKTLFAMEMQLHESVKSVIDLAFKEAQLLENKFIGTEHLLLALIQEETGLAGKALTQLGMDLERTREVVKKIQEGEIPNQ